MNAIEIEKCCPECESSLIDDVQNGERICSGCGVVVAEQMKLARATGQTTYSQHDLGITTEISISTKDFSGKSISSDVANQMNNLRKWQQRVRVSSPRERRLSSVLGKIGETCKVLTLPKNVLETASMIYRSLDGKVDVKGKSVASISAATIFMACQQCDVIRSLDEICAGISTVKDLKSKTKLAARYYRTMVMELGASSTPVITMDKYISKIANLTKTDVRVERLALEISEKTKNRICYIVKKRIRSMAVLEIKDLHVKIGGKEILKGVNLKTGPGEVHAIMGPNGSGKSTLAYTLLAHPKYEVTQGDILLDGESILDLKADERAKKGLFLGFQYPTEVSGVGFSHFLRTSYNALSKALQGDDREVFITVREFQNYLKKNINAVGLKDDFLARYLNEGFSGGEKKRSEVLQMAVLKPKISILDEPDSGLDIDAVQAVAKSISQVSGKDSTTIIITHYARILNFLDKLDFVHVFSNGKIIKSGDATLAAELEKKGYEWILENQPAS